MKTLRYLMTYITANMHCIYHKFSTKYWHKSTVDHALILYYENFELIEVSCTCGLNFWRRYAATEQISRSA